MGTLFQDEQPKTLQCPGCGKYISSDAATCRFCQFPITRGVAQAGVEKEAEETRKYQYGFNKNILVTGIILFGVGGTVVIINIVSAFTTGVYKLPIWTPVIAVLGLGQIIYGLHGMYRERKRK